jgi:hypothetical protein
MKNKLMDLHNQLFETLERVTDRKTDGESLAKEIMRARVVVDIAEQLIKNGMLMAALEKLSNNSKSGTSQLLLE